MDILKRIDQAQQFCKFYADGAYSVETEKWNHHVNPEFIEDIRQYIESLQLKLMHLQTQQAYKAICKDESYDMIDRFLRNNLYDDDYESFSEALHEIATTPQQQEPRNFCPRCGKRTADLTVIHTCTPPEGGHQ
jgi:two-component SAPR family response regulator